MSIARAVLEYCADPKRLGAKTLFATHYHELTSVISTIKVDCPADRSSGQSTFMVEMCIRDRAAPAGAVRQRPGAAGHEPPL